uniref:Putative nuclease HARBI1 n=1 Tax=Astyanax mexicanus TaxID=7994 RepID=A0A3B1IRQ6_ASTMX
MHQISLQLTFPFCRTIWIRQRCGVWWKHVVTSWTDCEWKINFRKRKTTFLQLCDLLQPHLQRDTTTFRKPVPVEQRVAICIWRLATNVEYRTISHLFGIGQSTAVTITNHVARVIVEKLLPIYIRKPSAQEFTAIIQGFRDRWGFPQCAGAIDGTHGILAPPDSPTDYYNRKGFHSVILQGVVDHRLQFWDINVGWPGKVHDARVFGNSSLYEKGQSGQLFPNITESFAGVDVPVMILGDAAYPLLPWLMKPYPENQQTTQAQTTFNNRLSRARMTVERAFGLLKGRWRCLMKRCDCHISNINNIITACCVLHNFCEVNSEEFDVDVQQGNETEWNAVNGNATSNAVR